MTMFPLLPHSLSLCGTVRLCCLQIQRLLLSLFISFPLRSKSLWLHLLPAYVCHHIQSIRKPSAAFDFFPLSSPSCYHQCFELQLCISAVSFFVLLLLFFFYRLERALPGQHGAMTLKLSISKTNKLRRRILQSTIQNSLEERKDYI